MTLISAPNGVASAGLPRDLHWAGRQSGVGLVLCISTAVAFVAGETFVGEGMRLSLFLDPFL